MAVLQKIRSNLIAQLAIGLGMVAFIVTGFVTCSRSGEQQTTVVTELYGDELEINTFNEMLEEYKVVVSYTKVLNQLYQAGYPLPQNTNEVMSAFQQAASLVQFTNEEEASFRNDMWELYVQESLLKKECSELGLTVTDNELAAVIKEGAHPILSQYPIFFNFQTGAFDYASLQQFLNMYKNMKNGSKPAENAVGAELTHTAWLFVEKQLRTAVLRDKYQTLLCSLSLSNPISAKASYDASVNETDIVLAALPYTTLDASKFGATDEELKAKLEEFKDGYCINPVTNEQIRFYNVEESRSLKYITVTVSASEADKQALNDAMNGYAAALEAEDADIESIVAESQSRIPYIKFAMGKKTLSQFDYEIAAQVDSMAVGTQVGPFLNIADNSMNIVRLMGRTTRPDSIEVRQIQIANADVEAAKATADSLIALMKAGEPFDSVAKDFEHSDKTWMLSENFEGSVLPEEYMNFLEAIYATSTNDYFTFVPEQGGVIIGQVTDRREMDEKFQVAIIKRPIEFSAATFDKNMNDLSTFVNNCKDLKEVEQKAAKAGYNVQQENVLKNTNALSRVEGTREIVRWAFKEDTEVGTFQAPRSYGNTQDQIVVAFLAGINPAGYATLDDPKVKEAVAEMVKKDKMAAELAKQMKGKSVADIAKMAGAFSDSVQHVTFSQPTYIMSMGVQELNISGAASALAANKTATGIRGNAAVYAIQATGKATGVNPYGPYVEKEAMMQHAMQNASIINSMLQMRPTEFNGLFYPLMKKADMVDNRHIFF